MVKMKHEKVLDCGVQATSSIPVLVNSPGLTADMCLAGWR